VCHRAHVHVNQKTQKKKAHKPAFFSAKLHFATETSYAFGPSTADRDRALGRLEMDQKGRQMD
jgi:Cu/Zn superoxide dismutase